MDIGKKEIVPDLRVYEAASVCKDHGRTRMKELESRGAIKPLRTPTGRCLLTVEDAVLLAKEL